MGNTILPATSPVAPIETSNFFDSLGTGFSNTLQGLGTGILDIGGSLFGSLGQGLGLTNTDVTVPTGQEVATGVMADGTPTADINKGGILGLGMKNILNPKNPLLNLGLSAYAINEASKNNKRNQERADFTAENNATIEQNKRDNAKKLNVSANPSSRKRGLSGSDLDVRI